MMGAITLKRIASGRDSTIGMLFFGPIGFNPQCFIIEDEFRAVKVKGETRIPSGKYQIKKRKVKSPMTLKYREIYPFFDYHLELQNVPNFKFVYIHHGNKESNTDGCLLCNYNAMFLDGGTIEFAGGRSRDAFEVVYKKITSWLDDGIDVFINVIDE
jgi:hypothetical protein